MQYLNETYAQVLTAGTVGVGTCFASATAESA